MKNSITLLLLLSSIFLNTNSYGQTEVLKAAPEGKHYEVIQFYIGEQEHARVILVDDGFLKSALRELEKSILAQIGSAGISFATLFGLIKGFLVYRKKLLHVQPPSQNNNASA